MTNRYVRRGAPEKPSLEGLETFWSNSWEHEGVYVFDRRADREGVYSIDTPPPTASGELHIGHVFSYTQTDALARFHRMRGKSVFYPMGWDDNGLPTERRVQIHFGVRCDPALPYDPRFAPPATPGREQVPISRRNFIELCEQLTVEDEKDFEQVWRRLGLSVDWSYTYQTIGGQSRADSQAAFLRALGRGEAYQNEAPTLWDVTFRTAVAQAELEDRERPGAYHRLAFTKPDGGVLEIATTRPELLAACVAVVAHPDDERFAPLVGATVRTPVFGVDVPVLAHRLADPEKGTGAAMVCTFGDTTDVTWWRELNLAARPVLGRDGRILAQPPTALATDQAREAYARLAGKTVFSAREQVVALLRESGALLGEPTPITHAVKFYEKGDKPLEIVTTRQWYLRNGGRDERLRETFLERGRELVWHPPHMRTRYEAWVTGLNGDWLVSRQRFFGVPLPVWYRVGVDGEVRRDEVLVPDESALPVDPSIDVPPGFTEAQRGAPGGFAGDPDVMDTWATSSLTPQIVGGWRTDPDLFARVFPMDLRPQAHEIIRTWLFSTVVRAQAEQGVLPWRHAAIAGWILDPDRKKMSKSKQGSALTPDGLLAEHGSDAVRYWAVSARPGVDTAFDTDQMKVGRRLAIKILNASKFVLGFLAEDGAHGPGGGSGIDGAASDPPAAQPDRAQADRTQAAVTQPLDRALLARLAATVEEATAQFEAYDYARALEVTERFFWDFCDDYVELVKARAYGEGDDAEAAASAHAALAAALSVVLRLFAPHLPFATEETWSWWQEGSVHRAPWPQARAVRALLGAEEAARGAADPELLEIAADAIQAVRKAKSELKLSMRAEVAELVVTGDGAALARFRSVAGDVRSAGRIAAVRYQESHDGEGPDGGGLGYAVRIGRAGDHGAAETGTGEGTLGG